MTESTARRPQLRVRTRTGLVLAGLLGLTDLISLVATPTDGDEPGPPLAVLVVSTVLGVITIAAAVYTWRTGNRVGARVVAGSRILSMLGALPAFFVPDVPAGLVVAAALSVVLTLVAVVLVLTRSERRPV